MIEVESLCKTFAHDRRFAQILRGEPPATTAAVRQLSFAIADGEIFGLVGPNGAGKTTLLRLLSTLLVPTSGRARVAGFDVVADAEAVRRRIGLVASNERSFFWRLTGRQNLAFFADLYQLPPREAGRWIDELLELLDLRALADHRFDGYSTGTKQRFAIARGLLHRPQVLFMDEPTKGVDPKSSADIIALIRDRVVTHAHHTVIITTHNLREIERLCHRTLIMERGRMAYLGTTADLKRMVTGCDTYRIELTRLPDGVAERLSRVCALPVARSAPDALELKLPADGSALDDILRLLSSEQCGIRSCTRIELPIEEAFVAFLASRRRMAADGGEPGPA